MITFNINNEYNNDEYTPSELLKIQTKIKDKINICQRSKKKVEEMLFMVESVLKMLESGEKILALIDFDNLDSDDVKIFDEIKKALDSNIMETLEQLDKF